MEGNSERDGGKEVLLWETPVPAKKQRLVFLLLFRK